MPTLRSTWRRARDFFARLPLTYRPGTVPAGPLRELMLAHNRTVLAHHRPGLRALALAAAAVAWPVVLIDRAAREWRENHRAVRALGGPSALRQAADLVRLGLTRNLAPRDYYYFNGWQPEIELSEYLPDGRTQQIFRALNRGVDTRSLDDKLRFNAFARAHGLASVPVLAWIGRSRTDRYAPPAALECDLFVKPRAGRRSRGTSLWRRDAAAGGYRRQGPTGALPDGPAISWDELVVRLSAAAGPDGLLVQPLLRSHPGIADLGNGALCTVRVITAIGLDGEPAEFSTILNLPGGTSFLSDGGIAAPVEPETGRLVVFLNTDPGHPQYTHHPVTGVAAASRTIPAWRETVALACRAHAQLREIAFIGWDIALTDAGPVLLEGNHGFGVNTHQIAPNPPLGRTRFPALVLHHLRQRGAG